MAFTVRLYKICCKLPSGTQTLNSEGTYPTSTVTSCSRQSGSSIANTSRDCLADRNVARRLCPGRMQLVHLPDHLGDAVDFPFDPLHHVTVRMVLGHGVADQAETNS